MDRIAGRMMAAIPGLSDMLPQKYDTLGRPLVQGEKLGPEMFSRFKISEDEKDPAIIALRELSDRTKETVLTSPDKNITIAPDQKRKLTDKEFWEYQRVSGDYILKTLQADLEWTNWPDDLQIKYINKVKKDMRAYAREELFLTPPDIEEEEPE